MEQKLSRLKELSHRLKDLCRSFQKESQAVPYEDFFLLDVELFLSILAKEYPESTDKIPNLYRILLEDEESLPLSSFADLNEITEDFSDRYVPSIIRILCMQRGPAPSHTKYLFEIMLFAEFFRLIETLLSNDGIKHAYNTQRFIEESMY